MRSKRLLFALSVSTTSTSSLLTRSTATVSVGRLAFHTYSTLLISGSSSSPKSLGIRPLDVNISKRSNKLSSMSQDQGVGLSDIGGDSNSKEQCKNNSPEKTWRSLLEVSNGKSRKIKGSNYVQLATVDPETNGPRCRCVVFRGFVQLPSDHKCAVELDDYSCVMRMITDLRSQKVQQVQNNNNNDQAELLWWFQKSNEQYRIRGKLIFVGGKGDFAYDSDEKLAAERKQTWGNMSDSAREAFYKTPVPGQPIEPENKVPEGGRGEDGKVLPPPDNFLLMLLLPTYVDYLRLGQNQYRQIDECKNGTWVNERVNP